MKHIRHSPEPIIRKLRETDPELASGKSIAEVSKALGVAESQSCTTIESRVFNGTIAASGSGSQRAG